jgi:hypothetical protein
MKGAVAGLAMAALLAGSAFGQASGQASGQTSGQASRPAADPLTVTPISPSQARTGDADMIRAKIEQAGYTEVTGLSRDSMGVWRARARKGGDVVGIVVDKGGRIKPEPR